MITEALLGWFSSAATSVLGLMPTSTLPLGSLTTAWSKVFSLNWFLPISEVSTFVLTLMALGPALLITSITSWLVIGVARGGSPTL